MPNDFMGGKARDCELFNDFPLCCREAFLHVTPSIAMRKGVTGGSR